MKLSDSRFTKVHKDYVNIDTLSVLSTTRLITMHSNPPKYLKFDTTCNLYLHIDNILVKSKVSQTCNGGIIINFEGQDYILASIITRYSPITCMQLLARDNTLSKKCIMCGRNKPPTPYKYCKSCHHNVIIFRRRIFDKYIIIRHYLLPEIALNIVVIALTPELYKIKII